MRTNEGERVRLVLLGDWSELVKPGGVARLVVALASAQQRRRTPVDFAKFLIGIAATCAAPELPGEAGEPR